MATIDVILQQLVSNNANNCSNLVNLANVSQEQPALQTQLTDTQDTETSDITDLGEDHASQESSTSDNEHESSLTFDKELFLEEIRQYRCLWDINFEDYKNRPIKQNAWSKLGQLFSKDVEFLQRQMKNLKDALKKCLNKRNNMTRSAAAASSLPKCKYFEQMRFLHEKIANKPTVSNCISDEVGSQIDTPSFFQESDNQPAGNVVKRKARDMLSSPPGRSGFKTRQDVFDKALLKELETTNDAIKLITAPNNNDDEVSLYCKSLIPIISSFPLRKKRLAMIKVSELLFELEFENE